MTAGDSRAPQKDGDTMIFKYETSNMKFGRSALIFGVLAVAGAWYAVEHRGIEALMSALAALFFAGLSVASLVRRSKSLSDPKSITLRGDAALLPRASFGGGFFWVRYKDIQEISEEAIKDERLVTIRARDGTAVLSSDCFASEARFVDCLSVLAARWKGLAAPVAATKRQSPATSVEAPKPGSAGDAAVLRAIQMGKANDPIIGAKFAGEEIFRRLTTALARNDPRGIHTETLLCSLGALAGYACQASLRAQALVAGKAANSAFNVVKTNDGKEFYFGDEINRLLAEDKHSVWSVAAGAAQHAGASSLPDINEMFKHTAASVGSDAFGVIRYPGTGAAAEPPLNYLKALWPVLLPPVRELTGDPRLWPLAYGIAIQKVIEMSKNVMAPHDALTIIMEAAIPMSKVKL